MCLEPDVRPEPALNEALFFSTLGANYSHVLLFFFTIVTRYIEKISI